MSRVNLGAGAVKKAVKATTKKLKEATARNKPYESKLKKLADDLEKSTNKMRKARGLKELTEKDFKSQAKFFKERYRRYAAQQTTGATRAERSALRKKVKEDMKKEGWKRF